MNCCVGPAYKKCSGKRKVSKRVIFSSKGKSYSSRRDVLFAAQARTPERNFTQTYSAVMTAAILLSTQAAEHQVTINTNSAWRLSVRLQCVNNLGQNPLEPAHHVHTALHNIAWISRDRWFRVTVTWECPRIE